MIERKGCDVDITNKNLQNAVQLGLQVKMSSIDKHKLDNNVNVKLKKAERREQRDKNLAMFEELIMLIIGNYKFEK